MQEFKGKSICVFSPKGGVGKSIITMNLSSICSLLGKKTLIIDFDLYNECFTMFTDKSHNKNLFTILSDIKEDTSKSILNYVYKYNDNIDILCSSKNIEDISLINSNFIENLIKSAENIYDIILIDTNPNLFEINKIIFNAVHQTLYILTNDIMNIRGLKKILTINQSKKHKILLNKAIIDNSYFSYKDLENILKNKVDYTLGMKIKNIDSYLFESKMPFLIRGKAIKYNDDIKVYKNIIEDLK